MLPERTDAELKRIAVDIEGGSIFTSFQLPPDEPKTVQYVFTPMMFVSRKQAQQMQEDDVVCLYEYLDNRLPRNVNGYPTFSSCYMLSREQWAKIQDHRKTIREFLKD